MQRNLLMVMLVVMLSVACTSKGASDEQAGMPAEVETHVAEPPSPTATATEMVAVAPTVPAETAQPVAEVKRATPTLTPPPTPTPPPMATPRPLALAEGDAIEAATAEWIVYEDRELGIRFRYPPEYEGVRVQESANKIYLDVYRKRKDENGFFGEEYFAGLFITHDQNITRYMQNAEDVEKWIKSTPFASHVGGRVRVVGKVEPSVLGGKWTNVWYLQWEPLLDDWYKPIHTLLLVKDDFVVWVDIGDLTYGKPADDALWQQQMAFVKTIEPLE